MITAFWKHHKQTQKKKLVHVLCGGCHTDVCSLSVSGGDSQQGPRGRDWVGGRVGGWASAVHTGGDGGAKNKFSKGLALQACFDYRFMSSRRQTAENPDADGPGIEGSGSPVCCGQRTVCL